MESDTENMGPKKIRLVRELRNRLPEDVPDSFLCRLISEKQYGARQVFEKQRNEKNRKRLYNFTKEALEVCGKSFGSSEADDSLDFQLRSIYLVAFGGKGLDEKKKDNQRLKNDLLAIYEDAL